MASRGRRPVDSISATMTSSAPTFASPATAARGLRLLAPSTSMNSTEISPPSVASETASSTSSTSCSRVKRKVLLCRAPAGLRGGQRGPGQGGIVAGLSSALLSTFSGSPSAVGHCSEFSLEYGDSPAATASPKRTGPQRFCTVLAPAATSTDGHGGYWSNFSNLSLASSHLSAKRPASREELLETREELLENRAEKEEDQSETDGDMEKSDCDFITADLDVTSPKRRRGRRQTSSTGDTSSDRGKASVKSSSSSSVPDNGPKRRGRLLKPAAKLSESDQRQDLNSLEKIPRRQRNESEDYAETSGEEKTSGKSRSRSVEETSESTLPINSPLSDESQGPAPVFKMPTGRARKAAAPSGTRRKREPSVLPSKSMIPPPPPRFSTAVAGPSNDDDLQSLMANARYLKNWVPTLHSGKKFIVEGDLLDFTPGVEPGAVFPERWKTSKIRRRRLTNLIETTGSAYVLEGRLNFRLAMELNLPQFIIQAFANGFPKNWEVYRDQWRVFLQEQMVNCSAISATTSVGNASAFVTQSASGAIPNQSATKATPQSFAKPKTRQSSKSVSQLVDKSEVTLTNKTMPILANSFSGSAKDAAFRGAQRSSASSSSDAPLVAASPSDLQASPSPQIIVEAQGPNGNLDHNEEQAENSTLTDQPSSPVNLRRRTRAKKLSTVSQTSARSLPKRRAAGPVSAEVIDQPGDSEATCDSEPHGPRRGQRRRATKATAASASISPAPKEKSEKSEDHLKTRRRRQRQRTNDVVEEEKNCDESKGPTGNKRKKESTSARGRAASRGGSSQANKEKNEPLHPAFQEPAVSPPVTSKTKKTDQAKPKSVARRRTTATKAKTLQPTVDLGQLVTKPRTVRDRMRNADIMQNYNAGHTDDLFESSQVVLPKGKRSSAAPPPQLPQPQTPGGPNAILNDLFGSDSENDISMHSARTPIGNYIKPTGRRPEPEALTPDNEEQEERALPGFREHAFIHKKMKEQKKLHRLYQTRPQSPLLIIPHITKSKTSVVVDSKTSKIMREVHEARIARIEGEDEEEEGYAEPYFSEEEEEDEGSLVGLPTGLQGVLSKEQQQRRKC